MRQPVAAASLQKSPVPVSVALQRMAVWVTGAWGGVTLAHQQPSTAVPVQCRPMTTLLVTHQPCLLTTSQYGLSRVMQLAEASSRQLNKDHLFSTNSRDMNLTALALLHR